MSDLQLTVTAPSLSGPGTFRYPTTTKNEPIRQAFAANLIDLFCLFNQKQDERGPENVIKAGADGILTQCAERIERVRAALSRGKTSREELRLNALDIAGFGIILTQILDGTWRSEDGRKPSLAVASAPPTGPSSAIDDQARALIRVLAEQNGWRVQFDPPALINGKS